MISDCAAFLFATRFDFLDLGLGSANKSALLLSQILHLTFVCGFFAKHRVLLTLSVAGSIAIASLLILTESRGVIFSTVLSFALMLFFARKVMSSRRLRGALLLSFSVFIIAFFAGKTERYTYGMEDGSTQVRVLLWKAGLQMLWDAPSGWGKGMSGEAYTQWYQPLDEEKRFRTLVNAHLTWLTERGWEWRLLYPLLIGLIFALCYPYVTTPMRLISSGVWLTFIFANGTSTLWEYWAVWLMPVVCLLFCLWHFSRSWLRLLPFRLIPACVLLAALLIASLGILLEREHPVQKRGERIILGSSPHALLIVNPSKEVLGKRYGQKARMLLADYQVEIVEHVGQAAETAYEAILYSGEVEAFVAAPQAQHIFINPRFREALESEIPEHSYMLIGGLLPWNEQPEVPGHVLSRTVFGSAHYISQWPSLVLKTLRQDS